MLTVDARIHEQELAVISGLDELARRPDGGGVIEEFDGVPQSLSTHCADAEMRVVLLERLQPCAELLATRVDVGQHGLLGVREDIEDGVGGGEGDGVSTVGTSNAAGLDARHHLRGRHDRRQGEAVRNTLRSNEDVGNHAVLLHGEVGARATWKGKQEANEEQTNTVSHKQ